MNAELRLVHVDPSTDQVLWVCSGATAEGRCPTAEEPPYVCHGLKLVAADGRSIVVETTVPGTCPALAIP